MSGKWLFVLWTAWGAVIALLVVWLDRNIVAAASWLCVGMAVGCLGPKLAVALGPWVFDWYDRFWHDEHREWRIFELSNSIVESEDYRQRPDGEDDYEQFEAALANMPEGEEYRRLIEEEAYGTFLSLPWIVGAFHGTLLGGLGGALCPLDPDVDLPAWQGAALGVIVGAVGAAWLAAAVSAVYMSLPGKLPLRRHIAWRLLMVVSPVLVIPAMVHCVKRLLVERRAAIGHGWHGGD